MRAATQRLSLFLSFALSPLLICAQPYEAAMIRQGLVDVQQADPSIQVALAYSTTQNFVGRDVYGELTRAYLQPMAALKLATASRYLQQRHPNLRLLVYDAARPQRAQQALWDALPQMPPRQRRQYVADPREGSIHSYGCAVDLTVATADGQPLDMGTPFDYFGELAYPKREAQLVQTGRLTRAQLANRLILREAMERAGFMRIEYEWWHFNALSRARAKATYSPVR